MPKKYYAVKNGRARGVFFSWEECKAQVEGFGGAEYKSFSSIKEAESYVSGKEMPKIAAEAQPYKPGVAVAYVDGSYSPQAQEFSCGAVLFYEREKVLFSKKYSDPDMCSMRNVAGEIMGSTSVIAYCLDKKIPAVEIYHDYEGVAKWAQGEWKTNKDGTRAYADFCRDAMEKMKISFVKVKGHSGDLYNDEADALAKKALGIE